MKSYSRFPFCNYPLVDLSWDVNHLTKEEKKKYVAQ